MAAAPAASTAACATATARLLSVLIWANLHPNTVLSLHDTSTTFLVVRKKNEVLQGMAVSRIFRVAENADALPAHGRTRSL